MKINIQAAQELMKRHGKDKIFCVGKHMYFSKHNALITANGDEGKITIIDREGVSGDEEEDDEVPKAKSSNKNKSGAKKSGKSKDPASEGSEGSGDGSGDGTQTDE